MELPERAQYEHLDLLTHSRRQWRNNLPLCKLSTVESRICGRERQGDVPDSQAPGLHWLFTESGAARLLAPILRHYAIDAASLVDMLMGLVKAGAES